MLGAIIGDVVGSTYEFHNTKDYNFKLFPEGSKYTDDTIMSLAIASWLMKMGVRDYRVNTPTILQSLEEELVKYGKMFPNPTGGYGGGFATWLFNPEMLKSYGENKRNDYYESATGRHPYNSWGNGSAMRAAPVGWLFGTSPGLKGTLALRKLTWIAGGVSASITHDAIEGTKGASAVACAVAYALDGKSKDEIRKQIEQDFGYDLHKSWEYWYQVYGWDSSCQGTVPQAMICFLDSTDFEDAIRKAVSLGGDSDTLACITGGIAEAYYKEIPSFMAHKALDTLPEVLKDLLKDFQNRVGYRDIVKLV